MVDPIAVIEEVKKQATLQARTEFGIHSVLVSMNNGASFAEAVRSAGVQTTTGKRWRDAYPAFDKACRKLIAENKKVRDELKAREEQQRLEEEGRILPFKRTLPPPIGLKDFRWKYFGQPTPRHMELATEALEDLTNNYVFIFGPTGMGKDTLAVQYTAWRQVPDTTGRRVTTIMKTQPKALRRMQRMSRYLTDPSVYREPPERTPGGQLPTGSLIEDYGPFKWEPGMRWEDGSEVERLPWNTLGLYFLYSGGGAEQDPGWQALGVGGALQGDRVDEAILSDIFDLENQKSPTIRSDQLSWTNGILHSRLDEFGRMVMLGNWLHIPHNYEDILDNYTADASVIERKVDGPSTYTKYDNGVAVVIIKAIWTDPETGEERSYWPDRFPLEDFLTSPDGKEIITVGDLTHDDIVAYGKRGWRRGRGLYSIRAKDPVIFRAMYQQERDKEVTFADFDDATLDHAQDTTRSFGRLRPHEILVLGVDPARRYGAAWVLWAVDRKEQTLTIADFFWGDQLGYSGIKRHLILNPLARFGPAALAYEDNREGAVLADPEIHKVIRDSGVQVFTHNTGRDRGDREVGPGALAVDMRAGRILIPAATAHDKARGLQLRAQFKAWDINPDRSKPGRPGHEPDDLAMAAWIGWLKARTYIDRGKLKVNPMAVPDAVLRRFNAARARQAGTDPRTLLTKPDTLQGIHDFYHRETT